MFLGKVVGTVWATRKDEELVGMKFQLVKRSTPSCSWRSAPLLIACRTLELSGTRLRTRLDELYRSVY